MNQLDQIVDALEAAGVSTDRFIDVKDGEKKSVNHDQHGPESVEGNYGIYANAEDRLAILDIDDYDDLEDTSGMTALSEPQPTLEQGSPHGGTHRLYAVEPTDDGRLVAAALSDAFGNSNLKASWGEVRTDNQYVVGAGSQLDGCGKDWCSECAEPDGGTYELQAARDVATISAETLIDVLSADPELERTVDQPAPRDGREKARTGVSGEVDLDVHDVISTAYTAGDRYEHPEHGSTTGTNFMVDEGAETWRCWRHSCTGNALHLVGIQEGIIDCGDWQGGGLSTETWAEIFEAARERGLAVGPPPEHTEFDSTSDFDHAEVERGVAILESQTGPNDPVGDLTHHNGGYGVPYEYRDDEGNITDQGVDQVCNFTLETRSFMSIEGQQTDEFVLRVHPNHPTEGPYDVRIAPSVFNSSETFRSEVVTGRTTWFDPSNRKGINTVSILRYLRETVGAQPAPDREGQPYIGLSADGREFVTPNGSLTASGWTDDPEYEFYSIGGTADEKGPLAQKWQLDPDDPVDVDEGDVASICELLPYTRKLERGLPILGWFYAAPVKAFIHGWEREFPLLAPHGDTGTGKTSTLEAFLKLFGGDGEPLSSTDTHFTIQKHLAESRGVPIWVDEYKPTEMGDRDRDHLHQRLKEVTKERTMPKGRPDLGMDALHLRAPVVLSGEQKVADAAVRRRSILTNLSREPTRDGTETRAAFGELTGTPYEAPDGTQHYPEGYDLRQHARAYYGWVLEEGEDALRRRWDEARERVNSILDSFDVTVEASEQRGLQTVLFGFSLYEDFATAHGADPTELPGEDALRDACLHVVENIGKDGQRREHADEFLEALSLAATEGEVEHGVQHRVLETSDGEVLAVHMPSSFSAVKRYVRDSNLEDEYTLLSKNDYINSFGNKADAPDSYVEATNKRTRKIENGGRAVHFDHEALSDKLGSDFNIDAFRPEDYEPEDEPESESDEDGDGGDPLPLDELEPGYQTIEAEVASIVDPAPWLEAEATLADGDTKLDFVARGDTAPALEEGTMYRFEDIKIGRDQDGVLEAEYRHGATEVYQPEEAGEQTGLTSHGEDEGAEATEAATDGGAAAAPPSENGDAPVPTDAEGSRANVNRLVELLEAEGAMERATLVAKATQKWDMDPEKAEAAVSAGMERGAIMDAPAGGLKSAR